MAPPPGSNRSCSALPCSCCRPAPAKPQAKRSPTCRTGWVGNRLAFHRGAVRPNTKPGWLPALRKPRGRSPISPTRPVASGWGIPEGHAPGPLPCPQRSQICCTPARAEKHSASVCARGREMGKLDAGFDYHRYRRLLAEAVDENKRMALIDLLIEERARDRLEAERASDRAAMTARTIATVLRSAKA